MHGQFVILVDANPKFLPVKDRLRYRREKIVEFMVKGLKQQEIAMRLHSHLSTIEKDIRVIREKWVAQKCENENSLSENQKDVIL